MESGWAIIELMGHRRLAGWLSEEEVAGAAFLRIDVPEHASAVCTCGSAEPDSIDHEAHLSTCMLFAAEGERPGDVVATQFYAAGAVYALTPTTEMIARHMAVSLRPQPVHRWELPAAPVVEAKPAEWSDPRPDDDCECGHERVSHFAPESGLDKFGACVIVGCDCTAFDAAIPF